MSLKIIKALLECKTVASVNHIVKESYDFNLRLDNVRIKALESECKKFGLRLVTEDEEIIECSYKNFEEFNDNQKMIHNMVWEHGYIVVPMTVETNNIDHLLKMIKESNGDNFSDIQKLAISLIKE